MNVFVLRESNSLFFFFFKQKTAYEIRNCDWSSDVCSSDLDGHITCRVEVMPVGHVVLSVECWLSIGLLLP